MSRVDIGDHVYLVTWPHASIIKAGYSAHSRWRDFESRGAELQMLIPFATHTEAFDCERALDHYLANRCAPAFFGPAAAEPFLGHHGGGYLECFAYDPAMLGVMLGHMRRIVAEQCSRSANALPDSNARTYGRTNELTDDYSTTSENSSLVSRAGGLTDFAAEVPERGADAPPRSTGVTA